MHIYRFHRRNLFGKDVLRLVDLDNCGYTFTMIFAFAEVIAGDMPDKLRTLRFDGLRHLQGQLAFYKKRRYAEELLNGIAKKKCRMILSVASKTELDRVLKPHGPHCDGVRFIPDPHMTSEEELICWSETSLKAPLIEAGYKRYAELFKEVFPEKSKDVFGGT